MREIKGGAFMQSNYRREKGLDQGDARVKERKALHRASLYLGKGERGGSDDSGCLNLGPR